MQAVPQTRDLGALRTGIGLAAVHVGALAVFLPNTFSWSAVVVGLVLYNLTGAFGITLGFHRLLTHRSLKLVKPLEYAVAILGTLALQGGPIEWISTHRAHHAHTDRQGDPHDVNRGLRWAHMQWLYRHNDARLTKAEQLRLAPDLANDKFYVFLENTYLLWQVRTLRGDVPHYLAGQQRCPPRRISKLPHRRQIDQQLVGCDPGLGGRLA
jgi:fatty-acid desaturase